jgi:ribosome-binding protein aMBF1 (putative translation factor)
VAKNSDDWAWVVSPNDSSTSHYQITDGAVVDSLGLRISQLREQAGLSAQDVEDYTGILKKDLLALEAGLLNMNETMEESLALVLGIGVAELRLRILG